MSVATGSLDEKCLWPNRVCLPITPATNFSRELFQRMNSLVAGQTIGAGRYQLVRELGRGGMGIVWLAHDLRLGEEVALKFVPEAIAHDSAALEDMRRETLKSRRLSHPSIIRIHDLNEFPDEAPFISMEYVQGTTLAELKARQSQRLLDWNYLKPLVSQLCDALDYAHRQKVVHRDLKPGNVMVDEQGNLKLADFGLAATAAESMTRLSRDLGSSGTPVYMSPQQMQSQAPKVADDIYALGASLYELLTSKPPFYTGDIYRQVLDAPVVPIAERLADLELQNEVPPDVAAVVMACLAKKPEDRPQSVADVARWIGMETGNTLSTEEAEAEEEISDTKTEPRGKSYLAVVIVVLVVAAVGAGILFSRSKANKETNATENPTVVPPQPEVVAAEPVKNKAATASIDSAPAFIGRETPAVQLDESFTGPELGPYDGVEFYNISRIARQRDGKILIGGIFQKMNGQTVNSLARLNPDGSPDTSFTHALPPCRINELLVMPDDQIVCGFEPIKISGKEVISTGAVLVRMKADGAYDGAGVLVQLVQGGTFTGLAQAENGGVLVACVRSQTISGTMLKPVFKLDARGRLDNSFNAVFPPSSWLNVNAIFRQADGRILCSTVRAKADDSPRTFGLVELAPSGKPGRVSVPDIADDNVIAAAVQPDGKVMIVGNFKKINGSERGQVARLNRDGTLDKTFVPPVLEGSTYWNDIHLHADGRVLLSGANINKGDYFNLMRLMPDGTIDPTVAFTKGSGSLGIDFLYLPDGKVLLAGQFRGFNGKPTSQIVRLMYDAAGKGMGN